jgi:hypothetical protein
MTSLASVTGVVFVDYHQWYIKDAIQLNDDFARQANPAANGLAGATKGAAIILTGINTGPVTVTVEIYSTEPGLPSSTWEDRQDLEFEAPVGDARVTCWDGSRPAIFPVVSHFGIGRYHLRVFASGRHLLPDLATTESVENYLIQAWPAQGRASR